MNLQAIAQYVRLIHHYTPIDGESAKLLDYAYGRRKGTPSLIDVELAATEVSLAIMVCSNRRDRALLKNLESILTEFTNLPPFPGGEDTGMTTTTGG